MKFSHGVFQLFLFLTILVWSCSETLYCHAQSLDPLEVETLKRIGSKLGKQWNFNVDPCTGASGWVDPTTDKDFVRAANVTCGNCTATYCHVIAIFLKRQNLTGPLPVEFANLKSLQFLDLTQNDLNGTIPVAWTSLPLITLSLLGNRISGRIPEELGNITTLNILVLEDNLFQGPVPSSLGKLVHLEQLLLSANNFTGELPESLGKLKNLTYLRIDGNPISGKIPSFMANWTKIQYLEMQGTSLEGPFPPSFSTLETLSELRVTDWEGGDGKFPPLENMKGMTRLVLRNLSISGELPEYIGAMANLKFLDLSFNFLSGQIPNTYSSLQSHIDFIYLTNNNLSGAIPDWILTTRKQHIDISYNNFNGSNAPPDCLRGSNLNVVSSYSSSNNQQIATCLRRNNPCPGKAKNFNLFINCGGPSLTVNDDEYQGDTDTEGPSYYNSYDDKWAYSSTGSFVHNDNEPFLAKNVSVLDMPDSELYTTARLSPLSLKYYGLCLQNGNYTVNLHFAEIMFTDDGTYFSVGRRLFDASIQGKKVLRDFNIAEEANGTGRAIIKSFTANVSDNTLEIHFQWAGKGTNAVPEINVYGPLISAISVTPNFQPIIDGNNTKDKISIWAILGIVAAGCVLMVLISIFIWFRLRRKNAANNELQGVELQTGYFTLRQIKAATGNFNAANKLGEGGFGPVYKGVLPDGSAIAVKQLSAKSRQGNREFINEIGMISALQHPNLVRLFGCCIEGNQLLLIYEYMENNNLGNALFGREGERLNLDWEIRCNICLDIARGLAYLHEESRLKIVHRDIKAANVLLDKDLNAKISDFGLARLCEEDGDKTHISTRIAGTIGYMAPEYAMRGYLTDKADVYSFGIVMLEVICGLSNTHVYRTKEDFIYLLDWALILQGQGELLGIVDKNLGENYPKEEALQMLNLALTCSNSSPSLRPTMSTVVSILDGKSTLPISSMKPVASSSNVSRFQVFEKSFDDSQSADASINAPWLDSSVSQQSSQDENTRQTSRLLSDFSTSSFDAETKRRFPKRNSTASF